MLEIRKALVALLEADAELMALAPGGVWFGTADEGTPFPYVLVDKSSGTHKFAFQGNPLDWDMWIVKGVGVVEDAEKIDKRCRKLLTDAELLPEGTAVKYLRPESDINYPEVVDGERYQHVGANYRITSEEEEA